MSDLTWRAADPADVEALASLFRVVETANSVGLEPEPSAIRSRLAMPRLCLGKDTLVALDAAGRLVAYAEAADMGVGQGVLRIRLTNVVHPDGGAEPGGRAQTWLFERAEQLRQEQAPDLSAVLGTRCGAGDHHRMNLLTSSGFVVNDWIHLLVRDTGPPQAIGPAPADTVLVPYDPRYDEATRLAHNDAYADSPGALLPDAESWPQHATGLPEFRAEMSFLALARDAAQAEAVVAFLFTLEQPDGAARSASLHCLGTRAPWRRRGLASALIGRALDACREGGFREATLEVRGENRAALDLYARLGFRDSGRGYALLMRPAPAPLPG